MRSLAAVTSLVLACTPTAQSTEADVQALSTPSNVAARFASPPVDDDERPAGAQAFDFLLGEWRVSNRALQTRMVGADDWVEWPATLTVVPILGGYGNVDRYQAVVGGQPSEFVTIRVFDPEVDEWTISYVGSNTYRVTPQVSGVMGPQGGVFHGTEQFEGQEIQIRYSWTHQEGGNVRWEQAFQLPGGTWETNWTADFERSATR